MARFEESWLLSVQLSPNRVQPDFDVDTEYLYPMFDKSPVLDGDLSLLSPATTQESISPDSEGEAESFHSIGVSPATSASMSIIHRTTEMQLLSPASAPLPPLPSPIPAYCFDSPQIIASGFLSLHRILCPSFDAVSSSAATTEHPLIANQQDGCPYHFTSFRDYTHSLVDTLFGAQVHHPQFLEWVGAP